MLHIRKTLRAQEKFVGTQLRNRFKFGLYCILVTVATNTAEAIPSFSRQTGDACHACHTMLPHLTAYGRQFKLRGYTTTGSEAIEYMRKSEEGKLHPNRLLDINKIPMVSVRILSQYASQTGGGKLPTGNIVPRGKTATGGQGFVSNPDMMGGYGEGKNFHLVRDTSLYVSGKVSSNMGTFLEFSGVNDTGGSFGLDTIDLAFVSPETELLGYDFTYGLRGNNAAFAGDPSNTLGHWGLTYNNLGLSTHTTLFDSNKATMAGGEAYSMWGNFEDGGLYVSASIYKPQGQQTADSYIVGNLAQSTSQYDGATGNGNVAGRMSYYFPEFWNLYIMIGGFNYAGRQNMLSNYPSLYSFLPTGQPMYHYTDYFSNYGGDLQIQWIKNEHLIEFFAVYEVSRDSKFFGIDYFTGLNYADFWNPNGTPVTRHAASASVDYVFMHQYGLYFRYVYQNSKQLQDLNTLALAYGLMWMPYENVMFTAEYGDFRRFNPGASLYGRYAQAFNTNAVDWRPANIRARYFNSYTIRMTLLF